MAGPCLNPCPEPPPSSHTFSFGRMPVDDEVTVGGLLVLADAGFDERRVFQRREAEGEVFANVPQRLFIDHPLAVGRIEIRPPRIVGNFESATAAARDAVAEASAMIGPDGKMGVGEVMLSREWVPKKNTSCFVGRIRRPIASGNSLPIHGPQEKTYESAFRYEPSESVLLCQVTEKLHADVRRRPADNRRPRQQTHRPPQHNSPAHPGIRIRARRFPTRSPEN